MDNCFVACGCDNQDGVTKADLDRFTDNIENVLNDEKGRRLFRNFMFTSQLRHGKKTLDFYETIERLLNYHENADSKSYRSFLDDIDKLMDESEHIDELHFAIMEKLAIARDSEDKDRIVEVLKLLKDGTTKALWREYTAFRRHFIPKK